jgi:hypothetical protein
MNTQPTVWGGANSGEGQFAGMGVAALIQAAIANLTAAIPDTSGIPTAVYLPGLQFSGSVAPGAAILQPASLTITAWITASGPQVGYPALVSYGLDTPPSYESYILQAASVDGNSSAQMYFLTGTGVWSGSVYGTTKLQPNVQYFLTATYDAVAGVASILVDGLREGSLSIKPAPLYYPSGSGLGIGRKFSSAANNFTGSVSPAIYPVVLTDAQIYTLYQAGILSPHIPAAIAQLTSALALL